MCGAEQAEALQEAMDAQAQAQVHIKCQHIYVAALMLLVIQAKMLAESMQGVMTKGEATELVKEKAEEVIGWMDLLPLTDGDYSELNFYGDLGVGRAEKPYGKGLPFHQISNGHGGSTHR